MGNQISPCGHNPLIDYDNLESFEQRLNQILVERASISDSLEKQKSYFIEMMTRFALAMFCLAKNDSPRASLEIKAVRQLILSEDLMNTGSLAETDQFCSDFLIKINNMTALIPSKN